MDQFLWRLFQAPAITIPYRRLQKTEFIWVMVFWARMEKKHLPCPLKTGECLYSLYVDVSVQYHLNTRYVDVCVCCM